MQEPNFQMTQRRTKLPDRQHPSTPDPRQVIPVRVLSTPLHKATAFFSLLYAAGTILLVLLVAQQLATAREDLRTTKKNLETMQSQLKVMQSHLTALTNQQAREKIDRRYAEFYSPRMIFARAEAARTYQKASAGHLKIFQFFETLARDHEKGIITSEDVWYQFRDPLLFYWCGWKGWVDEIRKIEQDSSLYEGYEKLVEAVIKDNNDRLLTGAELQALSHWERSLLDWEKQYRRELNS